MQKQNMVSSENGLPWEGALNLRKENLEKGNKPVYSDAKDRLFAWLYLIIGYGFIYVFSSPEFKRNLAFFTVVYVASVLGYVLSKGKKPKREAYFWMCVLLAMAVPYMFWSVMPLLQVLAVICIAAYWTLTVTGSLMQNFKTSQWVLADCLNAVVIVPFANFTCQLKVLAGLKENRNQKKTAAGKIGAVALGFAIALPVLMVVLPLLSSADAGFQALTMQSYLYIQEHFMLTIVRVILAIPVAAYLFGLVYGGIHQRNTKRIVPERVRAAGKEIRVVPDTAICTALLAVCVVYLLFMGIQGRYLFSAFWGTMPDTFTYAEYARRGFFELCGIAGLNLLLLFGSNLFSKTARKKNLFLIVMNVVLAVLTLMLIATAMSKMIMYISVFGLTVKRILTMAFMIWLTLTFALTIIWQKRDLPIVRICVIAGAVIFCMLCVIPVEQCIEPQL